MSSATNRVFAQLDRTKGPFNGTWDRDVSYFLGSTGNPLNLTGVNDAGLGGVGFGGVQNDSATAVPGADDNAAPRRWLGRAAPAAPARESEAQPRLTYRSGLADDRLRTRSRITSS